MVNSRGDDVLSKRLWSQMVAFGLRPGTVFHNMPTEYLTETSIKNGDGVRTRTGAVAVRTDRFTGRAPQDRFIVFDDVTKDTVDWNKINHKFQTDAFNKILNRMKSHIAGKDMYVFDGFVGADPQHRLKIRAITDHAWQSLFSSRLFIEPSKEELAEHEPEFTIISLNDFKVIPETDGTRKDVFILINLSQKIVLISGTRYAGELKKSMFSVMNFLLPMRGVFPMHCSANTDENNHTALFFGLSGTGKTTLSADHNRMLIGDDEHGWSDNGVFNFEGGCYAKCINLTHEHEPQIWNAIRDGAILENVIVDSDGNPDFDDNSITENTRVAYPLHHIPGAVIPSMGGHPTVIIFLTADAKGVLPPISKLTREGAMYHFMSGYTSKLAGTEQGVKKPTSVFSECFGAPFMPLPAKLYAEMLAAKITEHNTEVYLINTGWSGGAYGVGRRISIQYSRAMVTAALNGDLKNVKYRHDPIFNLSVPMTCPGVPDELLDPKTTWSDKGAYEKQANRLAGKFLTNFAKFKNISSDIKDAGPSGNKHHKNP